MEQRLPLVPRLRKRAVPVPLGLQRGVWVDDHEIDIDDHVRRAAVVAPGGPAQLDALVGEVMSRPLDLGRPLWEMVVAEGLAGGRTAVIARLHHAILDGVSGATAMAALLDLSPGWSPNGVGVHRTAGVPTTAGHGGAGDTVPDAVPSPLSMLRYAAASLGRQPEATAHALNRGIDTMLDLVNQNRELAVRGTSPPPALYRAPRTSLNGNLTPERRYSSLSVPLEDLELVREVLGPAAGEDDRSGTDPTPTINDVILCAVGGALGRFLGLRGESPSRSLVALVPVSTRGHASVPGTGQPADMGNYVSGMLVELATTVADPVERLGRVAASSQVAKEQEERAGGDLLEDVTRLVPPVMVTAAMRGIAALGLFDRLPPPFNVVVSTVVVPEVPLWWAGCPVAAVFPAAPVAAGVGLNVTSMTYRGAVHFGLLACPRLVPQLDQLALLLDDAVAELVAAALAIRARTGPGARVPRRGAAATGPHVAGPHAAPMPT